LDTEEESFARSVAQEGPGKQYGYKASPMVTESSEGIARAILETADDLSAVSYTHLDVYKRQGLGRRCCPRAQGCAASNDCNSQYQCGTDSAGMANEPDSVLGILPR